MFLYVADSLFEEMEKLNRATSAASEIRPLFRKLDGMKDKMKILMTVAKCEGKQSTDDLEKIRQLKQEAKKVYLLLEKNFDSASHVKNSVVSEPNGVLLKKQQMLKNELLEATPFYQKSHSVHQEIQTQDTSARQNQQRIRNIFSQARKIMLDLQAFDRALLRDLRPLPSQHTHMGPYWGSYGKNYGTSGDGAREGRRARSVRVCVGLPCPLPARDCGVGMKKGTQVAPNSETLYPE